MSFHLAELWSFAVILASAFVIGWGAEAAQTFLPRALALSVLAWLQTAPEFAVEATIAWSQQRDLMIANLTGSLRLLVGLGWPMIFFVHFFSEGLRHRKFVRELRLPDEDALSVLFVFLASLYFVVVLVKHSLTVIDSVFLILIYAAYLFFSMRQPVTEVEEPDDLPWVARQITGWRVELRWAGVTILFVAGGLGLYFSSHPFVETLQRLSVQLGVSTFVFVQWIAPFLSEFPEKVTAFNWARQRNKASLAVMNMVSSNINQWTMLAAMIPIVFNLSLGHWEPVVLEGMHWEELGLTLAQSLTGGLMLLDLSFGLGEAAALFVLWALQFFVPASRLPVMVLYAGWSAVIVIRYLYAWARYQRLPRAIKAWRATSRS